jgi:hypothetical protein
MRTRRKRASRVAITVSRVRSSPTPAIARVVNLSRAASGRLSQSTTRVSMSATSTSKDSVPGTSQDDVCDADSPFLDFSGYDGVGIALEDGDAGNWERGKDKTGSPYVRTITMQGNIVS